MNRMWWRFLALATALQSCTGPIPAYANTAQGMTGRESMCAAAFFGILFIVTLLACPRPRDPR